LRSAAVAAASSIAAVPALAQGSASDPPGTMPPSRDWNDPSTAIYPDPAFEIFDPRFAKYSGGTAGVVRIWTGGVWAQGPVWFGDQQRLIFSDIPNDRLMAYDVSTGKTQVFRQPSNFINGNTRDRQARASSPRAHPLWRNRGESAGEIQESWAGARYPCRVDAVGPIRLIMPVVPPKAPSPTRLSASKWRGIGFDRPKVRGRSDPVL
jgi:hypothetical protein